MIIKTIFWRYLALLSLMIVFLILWFSSQLHAREIITLDAGWRFTKGDIPGAQKPVFNDSSWEKVNVPHDWAIAGPFIRDGDGSTGKLPWKDIAWYRRNLELDPQMKGKKVYLVFDGIMAFPEIFINGKQAGRWDYGYNSFYLDITRFVDFEKENILAIRVDTRNHKSRWYPGAGIFRKVQLHVLDPVHVGIWGICVTTPIIKSSYSEARVRTTVWNKSLRTVDKIGVRTIISSPQGKEIARKDTIISMLEGKSSDVELSFTLTRPERWDVDNPALYKAKTIILNDNVAVDDYTTNFGVRSIRFDPDYGFQLNDRRVQLKGVNLHHDLGPLGAAFNERAMERQLEIMKAMGCNAIRTSHNITAPEVLDLCDRMGILVFNEAFDKWDGTAGITDTTDFEHFAQRNIRNFVIRDRNHPSIFIWSVGNEIKDVQFNQENGFARLNTMLNYVRKYDNTRPVTMVSSWVGSAPLRHFDYYDVHAWNYLRGYAHARQIEPNKSVIISESASTVSSRGFYEWPLPANKTDFTKSLQVSSYDLNAPEWAEISDDDFMWQEEENYVAGEFVWTGFDYLGEPTPYTNDDLIKMGMNAKASSRSSYFGIVDITGIPKDRYFLYKSHWKPDETTVHILPHWNWEGKEGKAIPVFVYTNGDQAELFVNGVSQGFRTKKPNSSISTERYRLMWQSVIYQRGELKAVAYKDGKMIGETIIKSAGTPVQIKLTADRSRIKSDGKDLSYITIEALDEHGNICPLADDKILFNIEGAGSLAGSDNGNPQSFEPFKNGYQRLFSGKAMVILQSKKEKGTIRLKATSEGLKSAETLIYTE